MKAKRATTAAKETGVPEPNRLQTDASSRDRPRVLSMTRHLANGSDGMSEGAYDIGLSTRESGRSSESRPARSRIQGVRVRSFVSTGDMLMSSTVAPSFGPWDRGR
jgi:hypothetical protein